ncbi:serine O-acetyltransferase [cyanobiont of Ornithocercus magnificus]|nr:serine O-acetyltransferase [cyanobiont of Ornithocercus magnificus]
MLKHMRIDLAIIRARDPAARGFLEILLCYPGFQALVLHRLSHQLWRSRLPLKLVARMLSQLGRSITGVEIHPGARIGLGVFIDHGMGVVIGETAEVGQRCLLYQGVTLGGTGKEHGKRHPTLADNVVVGAGAKILGAITIGANTRIGAGSVVVRDVEADCTVVGIPGRVIHQSGVRVNPLAHSALPDTEANVIRNLMERIDQLENQVAALQTGLRELAAGRPIHDTCMGGKSQNLKDREILEFLGDSTSSKPGNQI